jgi:hypothetical protein
MGSLPATGSDAALLHWRRHDPCAHLMGEHPERSSLLSRRTPLESKYSLRSDQHLYAALLQVAGFSA